MSNGKSSLMVSFVLVVLGFSGCASLGTYNPATGQREFIFVSAETEIAMGQDLHKRLTDEFPLLEGQALDERIRRIGQALASISDRQDYAYRFFVIDKEDLNAFTTPGGYVYIYRGLAESLNDDDAIAAVLAHEVGHCAARHIAKRFQAALGYNLIGGIIFTQLGDQSQAWQIARMSTNAVTDLIFKAFSRQDEYQADALGIRYMYLAGYDVNGMMRAFEFLQEKSKGSQMPAYLRTHPYIEDRIAAVRRQIKDIGQVL